MIHFLSTDPDRWGNFQDSTAVNIKIDLRHDTAEFDDFQASTICWPQWWIIAGPAS